ncbi:MAG: glucose/mannose transport system permease protein [Caballeronia sp.]|nr:glucose/mannose transport system permease protein [Caballeronia sp.]
MAERAYAPARKTLRAPASHVKRKPLRKRFALAAYIALLPMAITVVFAYLGTMLWSLRTSFTNSRTFASNSFAGVSQYVRLFNNDRWMLSLQNIVI